MSIQYKLAEQIISSTLRSMGYSHIEIDEKIDEKHLLIHADGSLRKIVLYVMILIAAEAIINGNSEIVAKKLKEIRNKAKNEEREPWSAQILIGPDGKLTQPIKWERLIA